jgi:uncharacterized membrane-anchored protein YhcB (DUF1043 family)
MEMWQYILLGFGVFLVLRYVALRYLVRAARKRAFYKNYFDVLNLPEYRVKGNYEE